MKTVRCLDSTSRYFSGVEAAIKMLEQKYPVDVKFAAAIGSIAMGLDNNSSDLDLYLVFSTEHEPIGIVDICEQCFFGTNIDLFLVDQRLLSRNVASLPYDKLVNEYGNIMPNSLQYNGIFNYDFLPGADNCKLTAFIAELCFAGMLFDNTCYLAKNISKLTHLMNKYSFLKRRFISVYGRLANYMTEPGNVILRSYLYSVYEVLTMQNMLEFDEMPSRNFDVLLKTCDNNDVRSAVTELFHLNKSNDAKEKHLIDPITLLNSYISSKLKEMKPKLIEIFNNHREDVVNIAIQY